MDCHLLGLSVTAVRGPPLSPNLHAQCLKRLTTPCAPYPSCLPLKRCDPVRRPPPSPRLFPLDDALLPCQARAHPCSRRQCELSACLQPARTEPSSAETSGSFPFIRGRIILRESPPFSEYVHQPGFASRLVLSRVFSRLPPLKPGVSPRSSTKRLRLSPPSIDFLPCTLSPRTRRQPLGSRCCLQLWMPCPWRTLRARCLCGHDETSCWFEPELASIKHFLCRLEVSRPQFPFRLYHTTVGTFQKDRGQQKHAQIWRQNRRRKTSLAFGRDFVPKVLYIWQINFAS